MLVRCKKCGENTACIGIIRLHAQTIPLYLVGSEIPHQEATTRTESRNRMFLSFLSVYANCRKDREALEWIKLLADFSQLFLGNANEATGARSLPNRLRVPGSCGFRQNYNIVRFISSALLCFRHHIFFSRNWKFISFKVDLTKQNVNEWTAALKISVKICKTHLK